MPAPDDSQAAPLPFERLVHADWSSRPVGRWVARADRTAAGWLAHGPAPVGDLAVFVDDLFGDRRSTLAGFDFPIGFPAAYAHRGGVDLFTDVLDRLGMGTWSRFYDVATRPEEISLFRPFYPSTPGGSRRQHLFDGLGVSGMVELTRRCERGGAGAKAASPMFWTLGAAAVGKAALQGWREVIVPARRRGARLWPFDGALATLAAAGALVLAETYPGDAYGQIGLATSGTSKTRQTDRAGHAEALAAWMAKHRVSPMPRLRAAITDGFGPEYGVDNGFDAVVGLLAMIGVVEGARPAGTPDDAAVREVEGWILGRQTCATGSVSTARRPPSGAASRFRSPP